MWIKDLIRKELGLGLGKKTKYEKSKYEGEISLNFFLTSPYRKKSKKAPFL